MNVYEPISIVIISSVGIMLLGPIFSILWRLVFDNHLSKFLTKCWNTHEVLRNLNSETKIKFKSFWITVVTVVIHFVIHAIVVNEYHKQIPNISSLQWVRY